MGQVLFNSHRSSIAAFLEAGGTEMAEYTGWQPHVTVAVVVERDGRFLVVEEKAEQEAVVYNQPAGQVDKDETLAEAARREALEETGWEVKLTAFLGFYVYTPAFNRDMTYYRACYLAEAVTHHPEKPLDDGILQAVWLTRDELAASGRLRSPLVLKCVDDALTGKRYPLELVHEHHA
jgi:8-oxo-dGTP pyrophosphatase MutT (NUDIX family)